MDLVKAPFEQLLRVRAIADRALEKELAGAGLRVGDEIHKHIPGLLASMRVKVSAGAVVLGAELCDKIRIRTATGEKKLSGIQFGDEASILTVEVDSVSREALAALGVRSDEPVRLMRRLPPMEYVLRPDNRGRLKLAEGSAARIVGYHHDDERLLQFTSAKVETDFHVTGLIGGDNVVDLLKELGVAVGNTLFLEGVEHGSEVHYAPEALESLCLKTGRGGVRIHLTEEKARKIAVDSI